jgi:ABC-type branched-subunit amino acid transport system permease subunit
MSAFVQPGFWVFVLTMAGIYGIFSLGLQVQYGVGGILNFGHVGTVCAVLPWRRSVALSLDSRRFD